VAAKRQSFGKPGVRKREGGKTGRKNLLKVLTVNKPAAVDPLFFSLLDGRSAARDYIDCQLELEKHRCSRISI